MWNVWDCITLGMIPPEMLHTRPIDLRHICLFYLGHIPACVPSFVFELFALGVSTRIIAFLGNGK